MADTKLSALTELAATPADADEVYIRDVSEDPATESKRITVTNLLAGAGGGLKVKAETRDMAAASGDVSYTGYGFTPTGLIIFANATAGFSIASSNPAKGYVILGIRASQYFTPGENYIVQIKPTTGTWQNAIVKSYDADGFTLTWALYGAPTGTINMNVFAFK